MPKPQHVDDKLYDNILLLFVIVSYLLNQSNEGK